MLDLLLKIFIAITFFAFTGFLNRKNLSESASESFNSFPDIKFYLSKRKFAWEMYGHSWYNPQGILSKLRVMYGAGGCYGSSDGNIHVNLSAVHRAQEKGHGVGGFKLPSLEDTVEYILEHEALHSAIRSHAEVEYEKQETEFKQKWNSSSRLGKIKIFYSQWRYGFGGGVPWNEEWIIKQLQVAKYSNWSSISMNREPEGGVSG